jgi:hypothetical protein
MSGVERAQFSPTQALTRAETRLFPMRAQRLPTLLALAHSFFRAVRLASNERLPQCAHAIVPRAAFREHKRLTGRPVSPYTGRGASTIGLLGDRTRSSTHRSQLQFLAPASDHGVAQGTVSRSA